MNGQLAISNARLVLRDEVVEGSVLIDDGHIVAIDSGGGRLASAEDCDGDLLLPGLIEMHTDHLERHMMPRPGVLWPAPVAAVLAHDAQIAAAGITTVYDAISVGEYHDKSGRRQLLDDAIAAVGAASDAGLCRADHRLHLRCEVSDPDMQDMLSNWTGNPRLGLISVMDHTPGQRQWSNLTKMLQYHRSESWSDEKLAAYVAERQDLQARHALPNRRAALDLARTRCVPVASHDDTTTGHVDDAVADGITISEFPTTREAARHARASGMAVIAGAPNVVRGGSHSGNIAAGELADEGLLDGLSSDYVPASLLHAALLLGGREAIGLPAAIAMVSDNVARMVGLAERGRIAPGLRADLVRVRVVDGIPVVRAVWREGRRVV
ncbi:MAG: alpha-D-ribose 1-methylphosphonate 5-triphosphate diphosphatase [Alphaproteobacteria bacterium]